MSESVVNVSGGTRRVPVNVTVVVRPARKNGGFIAVTTGMPQSMLIGKAGPVPPDGEESWILRGPTLAKAPTEISTLARPSAETMRELSVTSGPDIVADMEGVKLTPNNASVLVVPCKTTVGETFPMVGGSCEAGVTVNGSALLVPFGVVKVTSRVPRAESSRDT